MKLFFKYFAISLGIILLSGIGFFLALYLLFGLLFLGFLRPPAVGESLSGNPCIEIADEAKTFESLSGLPLPESATILTSCHGYPTFQGEFSYYVVLDTSSEDLNALRHKNLGSNNNSSDHSNNDWQKGPIPQALQEKSTIANVLDDEFQSSDIWYATRPDYFQLMILDPLRNRVIYEYSIE